MATKLKKLLKCDGCGEKKPDVQLSIDPYSLEINDSEVELNLCEKCYQDRVDDI